MDRRRLISGGAVGDVLKRVLDPEAMPRPLSEEAADLPLSQVSECPLQHFSFRAMACDVQFFFPLERYPAAPDVTLRCMDLVEQIENSISVYRPESDISRINRLARERPVPVDGFVAELISLALKWHLKTGGAYDCTMGPLSRLWGFRNRKPQLPDPGEIDRVLGFTGSRFLDWNESESTLRILNPDAEVDFNGIGKGFVIGRISDALHARQIGDWIIHAGQSSVTAYGSEGLGIPGWTVGVSHPLVPRTRIAEVVLHNQSLGTSGSSRQALVSNGQRYGHVLDPRTGWPANHWISMTVVHDCPIACDVLSTALFVMSPGDVDRYVTENPDVKVLGVRTVNDSNQIDFVVRNFAEDELVISN